MPKIIKVCHVGPYTLTEYFEHDDTFCEVTGPDCKTVYCSIADALAHACEWKED